MMAEGEEKRLVQSYKATNKQLRKQLQNLNIEVDRVLAAKINRIGLKKLPVVEKSLEKTNDVKFLQLQVDNLRKRLEHLQRDNDNVRARSSIDHMTTAKQLEQTLAAKKTEKEDLRKQVYWASKYDAVLNTTDASAEEMRLYDRIEQLNQELIRARKIEAELQKNIYYQQEKGTRKEQFISQSVQHFQKAAQEAEKALKSRIDIPVTHKADPEEWKQLKKDFLELKESKIWEENSLKEQNDRLRESVRELQLRLRQKKVTIENIRSLQVRRKGRNYSTLDNSSGAQNVRYRKRDDSYKYRSKG